MGNVDVRFFFLFVAWLLESGSLLYFITRLEETHTDVQKERSKFVKDDTKDDAKDDADEDPEDE